MTRNKIIDCIGANDEDVAQLRMLLRAATDLLYDAWRWGPEEKADLVVVDPRSLIGDSTLRRVQRRGIACAQLIEADDPVPDGKHLRKPLRREDLIALLNGVGGSAVAPLAIMAQGDDFFDMDFGEPDEGFGLPTLEVGITRSDVEREHDSFETLFKRDPLAVKPEFMIPEKLGSDAGVEFIRDSTTRSETRADSFGNPFARKDIDSGNVDPTFRRDSEARMTGDEAHPLSAYLTGRLLGGLARIALPGAPVLVVDPKQQVFHAEGNLPSLEPYAREPLRVDAWERLLESELSALRERVPARPYLYLQWMERYINSNGYLGSHLDPAGTYRLTQRLDLAFDYPLASKIASRMATPLRLDEIARDSEVRLAEVFDVVNAYDAIGYVQWAHKARTPR